ncbi:MAG TPA: hypothetical protein VK716_15810 [Terracidiphilus sp.]|nr:hypothetical protein [Terracidiphilus sp.]
MIQFAALKIRSPLLVRESSTTNVVGATTRMPLTIEDNRLNRRPKTQHQQDWANQAENHDEQIADRAGHALHGWQCNKALNGSDRNHAATAPLRLWSSQGFSAFTAWWPVKRNPVMHNCVHVCLVIARHDLVLRANRLKPLLDCWVLDGQSGLFPDLLRRTGRDRKQCCNLGEFLFIEHWHFSFAAPAPKQLHTASLAG